MDDRKNKEQYESEAHEEKIADADEHNENDVEEETDSKEKVVEEKGEEVAEVDEVSKEQKRIEELEKENKEQYDRMLRIQAEYDNYKRRTQRERINERKYQAQDLATELLPVLDNFERALQVEVDRKSTRLNSSHVAISYAVFCLKKKTHITHTAHPIKERAQKTAN